MGFLSQHRVNQDRKKSVNLRLAELQKGMIVEARYASMTNEGKKGKPNIYMFLILNPSYKTPGTLLPKVHALSMDLGGEEGIEIIRGPRALLFGSNTISGVVNVDKNSMPEVKFDHFHTYFTSAYNSGNKGLFNNVSFIAPMNKNDFRFSFQNRKAGNEMTPIGELKNTSLNNTSSVRFSILNNCSSPT